ncbi:MAG: DUF1566 domain-containing protein [Candidatus Paceibacterota bacterium]
MKKAITISAGLFITMILLAQVPQKISFQAVIRNSSDQLVTETQIGMQISILQGAADGSPVYTETQMPTTNANGLVSIEIGGGAGFNTIDWSAGSYFIETKTDPTGGTSYTITGTSQLLSVPYALYAKSAETVSGGITETDPVFTAWDKSTGITITESQVSDLGYYIETETDPAIAANFDFTDAANGDLLQFNGTKWVKVTPDYISDYTVTESDVTSHQAALSVTESQISDLGSYIETETDPVFTAWDKNYADIINTPTTITTAQAAAITSNTAKNTYPEADATKLASIEEGAEVNVQADWNQATTTADDYIKNKPSIPTAADGSETKVTAGTNVTVTGTGTTASPYVVNATGATALAIGQSYQGGIIFWLDATGQHGLIVATADQSTGIQWYNGTYRYTGTIGDGLYSGAMNTAMIIATQMADNQTGNFAAKVCADYSVTVSGVTYGDWYLPSKYELNLLNQQKTAVGGFASAYYWSSTEYHLNYAWYQYFDYGSQYVNYKSNTYYVRAVRAF